MTEYLIAKQKGHSLFYADNRENLCCNNCFKISKPFPNRTAHFRFCFTVIMLQATKGRSKSH